jgi:hypothetical protein
MNAAAGPAAVNAVTVDSMPVCLPARPALDTESLYFAINELRDEVRGSRKPEITTDRTCAFCRKMGHIARDCYKKRRLDRERLCYRCEQKGMLLEIVLLMSSRETNKRSDTWGVVWM